jgi:hypothetical protein
MEPTSSVDQCWVVLCVYEEPLVPVEKKKKNCLRPGFTLIFQQSRIWFWVQFFKKLNFEFGFENQIQFWSSSY